MMKKFTRYFIATLFLTIIISSVVIVSAADKFKACVDFNSMSNGFKIGSPADKGTSGQPFAFITGGLATVFNTTIETGRGASGNAMVFDCFGASASGNWTGFTLDNTVGLHPVNNCVGGTGFAMWVDFSKWDRYAANGTQSFQFYFMERAYKDGVYTGDESSYCVKGGTSTYIQDGAGWKAVPIAFNADGSESNMLSVPTHYRGWVKIPLSSFYKPIPWGNHDDLPSADLKYITSFRFGYGYYADDNGHSWVIDDLGFYGDNLAGGVAFPYTYQASTSSTTTTSSKAVSTPTTSKAASTPTTSKATSTPKSSTVASGASGVTSGNTSSALTSSDASISGSDSSITDSNSSSSAVNTAKKTNSNGFFIPILIIAGLLIIGAAIFIFLKIRKSKV
jgi:hypothetical protein